MIKSQSTLSLDEIIKNIPFYASKIETPFGEITTLYADNIRKARPFKLIEQIISQTILPKLGSNLQQQTSFGAFAQNILEYSFNTIYKSFNCDNQTHHLFACHATESAPYEKLIKILQLTNAKLNRPVP